MELNPFVLKWVSKIKFNSDESINKYKACLVTKDTYNAIE